MFETEAYLILDEVHQTHVNIMPYSISMLTFKLIHLNQEHFQKSQ